MKRKLFINLQRKLLLAVLLLAVSASWMQAQTRRISLDADNQSVAQILKQIEQKSGFTFFYKDNAVDLNRKVSVSVKDEDVLSVLGKIFAGTPVSATISGDKTITLSQKDNPAAGSVPSTPARSRSTVSGSVLDTQGQPVIGATVLVDGTQNGVVTDLDGNYTLARVPEGASIRFSCMGYVDQVKPYKGEKIFNAILYEDSESLEEAVAVAFGTQRKESVVGAVTAVKVDNLKAPSSNLTTTLAGNVAGIISYQRTGEPGEDDASFFIRGVTTFGNNKDPLILIDNIELTTTDLARLSTDDIESFTIMKDATATALYGSRAANGVILVKTKEGRKGKAKVNVRYEHSFSRPTQEIDICNDPKVYMTMHNEAFVGRDATALPIYPDDKILNTTSTGSSYQYPYTNWHDTMLKTVAQNDRANLNVSGGGDVAKYYVAATVKHDTGILNVSGSNNYNNNIDLTTYTLRSNVNVNVTKTTELIIRLSGTFDQYQGPISGGSGTYQQIMSANPVLFPAYYPSSFMPYANHVLYGNYGTGEYLNPYAEMTKGYREYGRSNMGAQFELKQDLGFITKGLSARGLLNTSRIAYYSMSRYCVPYYYNYMGRDMASGNEYIECINPDGGTDYLTYDNGEKTLNMTTYIEAGLNYDRKFGRHGVNGLLVYQLTDRRYPNASSLQESLPFRNVGLSGRFTYNFDRRYFTEFNFGYNGSEHFSEQKRFGFFPSVGVGWLISNEPFFAGLKDKITNLKLRASYGLVGNDNIGSTRFLYLSQINMNNSSFAYRFGAINGGYSRNGISISRYANDEIGWEIARKANFALEFEWDKSLSLVTEYYVENRDNILQTRASIPGTMGLSANPQANIGAAKGHGVDIELNYNKTFANRSWLQVRGNFTFAQSEYVRYEEPQYPNARWKSHVGYSVSQQWGYVAECLFLDDAEIQNSPVQFGQYMPGDIKYYDISKDGVIDELDQVPIGYPTTPEIIYGFGFSYGLWNFDLSLFFQGLARESFWIAYSSVSPFFSTVSGFTSNNQLAQFIADSHWSEDNRDIYAVWPRLSTAAVTNNNQRNTWFMRDGSFLRLKQMEFGYTLPRKLVRKAGIESLRFYVSGTNLWCWSNFKLWDPEMAGNGLGYPVQRVINLGVNVNF